MKKSIQLWWVFMVISIPLIGKDRMINDYENRLIQHVAQSIENAERNQSKLNEEILIIEGMSGRKGRHFLNNLCSLPNTHYLEVGTYKGSTFISALYGNENSIQEAFAIDNWSQFGGTKPDFISNIQKFIPNSSNTIIDANCFSVSLPDVFKNPINIYFYDGHHGSEEQEWAFTYYNNILDDVFIAVIDDWNWGHVRDSTSRAFSQLNYEVLFERTIYTNANGDPHGWWNGMYISVIRKNK